jgi:hypothetical protein
MHRTLMMKKGPVFISAALLAVTLSSCGLVGSVVKTALPFAGVKLALACIPGHTLVDSPSGPRPVERLEAGDWVTGFEGRPVRILQKHSYLESSSTVFFRVTFTGGAAVDLCGMHRVAGVRASSIRPGQIIAGRKVTGIESRRGETRSFDLLTEDAGYQIQGIPVNSMIEEMHAAAASGMRSVQD